MKLASNIRLFIKVLQHASIIPECGKLGVPPITPTTFEDYVIPFWFRESVFRQDANLGFLSNQKKSTQNTGVVYTSNILCNLINLFEYLYITIIAPSF